MLSRLSCSVSVFEKKIQRSILVIKQGSENGININFNTYDLLYLMRTIYRTPNFLLAYVDVQEYDLTRLLDRPG